MSDTKAPGAASSFNQLEVLLNDYLGKKAPAIPDNIKETLVSFAPYISIIEIVIALPAITAIFGLGAMMSFLTPYAGVAYMNLGVMYYIGLIGIIISAVLNGMAIPGLFKRTLGAWKLMYYATLASFVGAVIQGSIVNGLLGALIGMYVLFQVKNKYK